ncbi:uncharacterized protein LOC144792134 [Lissotriton helveticus]
MGWLEKTKAWDPTNQEDLNKIIYIDDLFIIWNGSTSEFDSYFSKLKSNDVGLQFTHSISKKKIHFLDLTVFIENDQIQTTLYRKKTATNSILHGTSFHPQSLLSSIPYGEFIRMKRNCTKESDAETKIMETSERLKSRGYNNKILKKCKKRVDHKNRTTILASQVKEKESDGSPRFVMTFSKESGIIRNKIQKYWHLISGDPDIGKMAGKEPLISYRKTTSLRNCLIQSHFKGKQTVRKNNWLTDQRNGFRRCNICKACKIGQNKTSYEEPSGKQIPIQGQISCASTHVVYVEMGSHAMTPMSASAAHAMEMPPALTPQEVTRVSVILDSKGMGSHAMTPMSAAAAHAMEMPPALTPQEVTLVSVILDSKGMGSHAMTPMSAAEAHAMEMPPALTPQEVTCVSVILDSKILKFNSLLYNPISIVLMCSRTETSFIEIKQKAFDPKKKGDGISCNDTNECSSSPCHGNATCTNTAGSYMCVCNPGFQGDGISCNDTNECSSRPCHGNATCNNTVGSYTCVCNPGFQGDGISCNDKNECISSPCHGNATCTNTVGSYTCICNPGFQDNGASCSDINECIENPCHKDATCTNTVGKYSCACNPGFEGNGTICCSTECEVNLCLNGGTCTRTGSKCEIQTCACAVGFEGPRCRDLSLSFVPLAIKALPKRTVLLRLESKSNMSTEDVDIKVQQLIADLPVKGLFNKNRDYSLTSQNPKYFMDLTSEFNYTGILDDIKYLNEKLVDALRNKTQTARASRATSDIALVRVMNGNLTSQADLVLYFGCGAFQKTAYVLNPTTFMCESKCIGYCKNNATCNLTQEGPLCSCVPFSIYTTSGDTCDIIAININAFFGILFGALAFLFLLVMAIGLTVYCCRKRRRDADDESFFQTSFYVKSLTGFQRFQDTDLASLSTPKNTPNLLSWKPRLDLVNTSMKAKIGRPQRLSESLSSDSGNMEPYASSVFQAKIRRPQRLSESLSSDSGNMEPYASSDSRNMEPYAHDMPVSFDVLAASGQPQRLSEPLSSDSGYMQPYTSSDFRNMEPHTHDMPVSVDVLAVSES